MSAQLQQTSKSVDGECAGGFDRSAFERLARLEENSFWFKSRNKLIVWAMRKFSPGITNFLEVGCGNGIVLQSVAQSFPQLQLSGSDLFEEALPCARQRLPQATLFQLDLLEFDQVQQFDAIGCFDVLEHVAPDELALKRMTAALTEHGHLIISVPQYQFLWSRSDEAAHHVRRYSFSELKRKCENAGLQLVYSTSFVSLLFPFLVASRVLQKYSRASSEYDVFKELNMPWVLNGVFECIQTVERMLMRLGITFPFGGSLLIVAQKNKNSCS
ncbi:MAG: class I SAM-dependent methyltransferase [Candidatus Angelobacter sp.]